MVRKETKYCEVLISTLSGSRIRGRFHVDGTLSSTMRPSDALQQAKGPFLLLTHATIEEEPQEQGELTILVRADGISHIRLESKKWATD